jgi:hypothetical protein
MKRLLFTAVLALLIGGAVGATTDRSINGPCGDAPEWVYTEPDNFARLKSANKDRVFTIILTDQANTNRLCKAPPGAVYNGCSGIHKEDQVSYVIVVRPRDFNDRARLCVLGHEVMHILGARHD